MQEIKTDIKRAILSKASYVSVLLTIVTIFLGAGWKQLFPKGAIEYGLMTYYHAEILFMSLKSDIVLMALPIVCSIPYTTAFLDEYTSGFINVYLLRCNKMEYIKGKIVAPLLSGGLILSISILLFFFITKIFYSPMEVVSEYAVPPFVQVLMISIQYFFAGALWASVGALLANISLSKYMAYVSPFVFFYVLVILQERYFRSFYFINPKEWLLISNTWVAGKWGAIILMLLLNIIVCSINFNVMEKRIDG